MKQPQRPSQDHKPAPLLESMSTIGQEYWRALIDGGEPPRLHPAFVPEGWYRWIDRREKSKKDIPVQIWVTPDGKKWVRKGEDKPFRLKDPAMEEDFGFNSFAYFGRKAITYEAYMHWMEHKAWPADAAADAITKSEAPSEKNGTPYEILWETLRELENECREWYAGLGEAGITNQEDADKAGNFASRFAEIEKEAKEARIEGRRPYLEAAEAVQKIWQPIQDDGAKAKTWAKGLNTAFLNAENARRLKEAAAAAERGEAVSMSSVKGAKAGTRGRAVSVQVRNELECTDFDALFAHFQNDRRFRLHPDVNRVLTRLAFGDLEAGKDTPGAKLRPVSTAV